MTVTSARAVFDRQLACLSRGDLEGLLENYAPDAVLLRFDAEFSGIERISEAFSGYLALRPRLVALTHYAESSDMIFYRALMEIAGETKETIGTMMFTNEKISRQTAAVLHG
ncbi:nuclear transport factor 2 family protein [Kitasatospora cinereorecta]|uniref:Nuclear transport factor 2 family protein n=1 Tax=Kitasatospora cinereorecta TaxID=285560 RepID=A0ABW0VEB9_9ACTN